MDVSPIGWLLLVVGPLLAVLRPKWLYVLTIVFLPFTATGVLNVGDGPEASSVQVSMFLGSLLLVRYFVGVVRQGRLPFPRSDRFSLIWLCVFTGVTAVSLVMPLWIDGRILVPPSNLLDLSERPLYLSSHNVTGVMYMVYGLLFTYYISVVNNTSERLHRTLKIFAIGSIFTCIWAILELICKLSGIPYPAAIFNTGKALSTMGYKEFLAEGVFRLSSVAVEPSVLAQTLLVSLSLYLPFVFGSARLFGKWTDRFCFAFIFAVLCLTTSSTAYLGLGVMGLLIFALFAIRGILKIKHVVLPIVMLCLFALLYALIPIVRSTLDAALFAKSGGYSALERLMTITNSYEMFLRYPILGVGWATVTSHDLVMNILGNAGILGFGSFCIAMYAVFRNLYRSVGSRNRSLRIDGLLQLDFALYVALGVTLITSAVSGFLNTFSFFWFVIGLAITAAHWNSSAVVNADKLELGSQLRS